MAKILLLLLLALLATPAAAWPQRCPDCARRLELSDKQWRCMRAQLPHALNRRRDPRRFEVDSCDPGHRSIPPLCPGCPPPPPVSVILSFAQQRCLSAILSRAIPSRPIDLETDCGQARLLR